jgi:hypothetical protein
LIFAKKVTVSVAVLASLCSTGIQAQVCTTQAKMPADVRSSLGDTALALGSAIKSNDNAKVQAATITSLASNFAATASLVSATSNSIAGDTLRVSQVYQLDATDRRAGDTTQAEFNCALVGSSAEVDFGITGLPPGVYGFAMVEAIGPKPWLLSFLLQQEGKSWKLAGFYPRSRTAGGHDGLWYWNNAREDAKNKQPWLAWVLYGEADQLLRPANFATSTNLDKLRSEQRVAAPPELASGLSTTTPLVVKAADGTEFRFTGIEVAGAGGGAVNLVLHLGGPEASKAYAISAAKALLAAHTELRQGFAGLVVTSGNGASLQETDLSFGEIS